MRVPRFRTFLAISVVVLVLATGIDLVLLRCGLDRQEAAGYTVVFLIAPIFSFVVGGAIGSLAVVALAVGIARLIAVRESWERRWGDRKRPR